MKQIALLFLSASIIFTSCKKDDDIKTGTFKGPEVKVHGGKAWTWVQISKDGAPKQLAVVLTDDALSSVPVGDENHGGHDHSSSNSWTIKLHQFASSTAFDHVGLGWNPMGHEPEMIYGVPHFDFHFYMMTPQQVAAIPPYEVDSSKFKNWPAAEYFPANYINPGGGVPQMGAHWIDVTSPELNGQPFTQTFIYGSYDGKVNFYEPMITLEFLKNTSNFQRDIPQPAKVQKAAYYPTKMKVLKHDGVTEVILDGFRYRS